MSRYWHLHCVDCKVTHIFDSANHMDEEILQLIKHSEAIAALDDLMRAPRCADVELRFGPYGQIDTAWFREHLGHQMLPIDEYGEVLGQEKCWEYSTCSDGHQHRCTLLRGHEGPCSGRLK